MRSHLLRLAAIVVLLGLSPALRPERAMACSCAPPDSPLVSLEQSAAVFSGELVSIDGEFPVVLTFEVARIWKGPVAETLVLTTSSLGAGDCGAPLYPGEAYLIYAYETDEHELLAAWFCTRTKPLMYAEEDLEFLGEGEIPGGAVPVPPGTGGTDVAARSTTGGLFIGLLAAGTIALAALAFRRRARQA